MNFLLTVILLVIVGGGWFYFGKNTSFDLEQIKEVVLSPFSKTDQLVKRESGQITINLGDQERTNFSTESVNSPTNPPTVQLVPSKTTLKVGETVGVEIRISSGDNFSSGSSVLLGYDSDFIVPVENPNQALIKGKIYEEISPPTLLVDGSNVLVGLTGINKSGSQKVSGGFATLTVKTLKSGNTTIKLLEKVQGTEGTTVIFGSKPNTNLPTTTKDLTLTIN